MPLSPRRRRPRSKRGGLRWAGIVLPGLVASACVPVFALAPAFAQDADQSDDAAETGSEDVLVKGQRHGFMTTDASSGTKTDTPLIETPQSVTVIPRAQLTQQDAHTLNEALRYTAGINTQTRGGSGNQFDQFTLRGFGTIGSINNTYLDGMKLLGATYITPQIDSYAVDRIEVLKGPASVLYGQSNPAGLINEVSKLPTATPYHELGAEGGTFGQVQGTADLSGPIDQAGHWLYRVTGLVRNGGAQVDHVRQRRVLVQPSLSWVPDTNTSLTLQGFYQRDPYGGYYGAFPQSGTIIGNPRGQLSRSFYDGDSNFENYDRTQYGLGYQLEHRFSDRFAVKQKFRWLQVNGDYRSVYTAGYGYQTQHLPNNELLARGVIGSVAGANTFTVDNQASLRARTGPMSHLFLLGVDYQNQGSATTLAGDFTGAGAPPLDIWAPVYGLPVASPPVYSDTTQSFGQVGFYGQDQIRIGRLIILGGGRYDFAGTSTYNRLSRTTSDSFDRKFTGRAGILYEFAGGIAPYFSYSQSFQPTTGTNLFGQGFKPTTGEQYEAGVKYQPPGWNTLITASAFQIKQNNLTTPDPRNAQNTIQAGQGRSRGFEVEAHASPVPGLDLVASYTYLDAIYTKDNSGLQGKAFQAVPKHSASGWADYTLRRGRLVGLGAGAGIRFIGPSAGNADNTLNISQTTLVDLTLHYDLTVRRRWIHDAQLYVNATNLFDRTYLASCYGQQWCFYGPQRTVLGGIRYHW
ncbi:TonB-dependent siderophore receptor [Rhizosaccharibacter radicis]|uniref:TonB-dependent siderophore receptor n=1 Tax=Rhizosaccharibacter radicis TaxID=2782605 RepID=A0ABT1W361_9PROT|nr:TonB-dependent siderophore receptor [Acetobacteraceae bacterium KSS12]